MANTPGILNDFMSGLFGGGQSAADALKANGYTPYQVTQGPNVSKNFQGYQGAQANTAANAPYQAAQSQLLGQLQGEASGTGGPTVADQQLQAGTGQALAAQKAAMAGQRGQNAGLAQAQLGTNLANTTAGAAGQAAAQRAEEQQNAQGALGGLTQGAIGQGNQLAEANQASTNQGLAATSQAAQNYGNLQNQDWQYTNNLNAAQQAQYNQMIGSMTGAADQSQANIGNQLAGSAINTGIQGLSQIFSNQSGAADGTVVMADGGAVGMQPHYSQYDLTGPGGGAGGGTGYDPTARMGGQPMADGGITGFPGITGPSTVSGDMGAMPPSLQPAISAASMQGGVAGLADGGISSSAGPMPMYPGISVATAPAPELTNWLAKKSSGGKPQAKPGQQSQPQSASAGQGQEAYGMPSGGDQYDTGQAAYGIPSPDSSGPSVDTSGTGADFGSLGATDAAGAAGAVGAVAEGGVFDCNGRVAGMADGAVSAPVAHGPEKAIIGENGPEAVVPIKPNGDVDPARARNPAVRQLLASHPGLRHIQDAGAPQGQPTGTGDHATAAALAMAGAHLSDRVAHLEQLLSSQARKSQRRAA